MITQAPFVFGRARLTATDRDAPPGVYPLPARRSGRNAPLLFDCPCPHCQPTIIVPPPRARKREAAPLCGPRHLRYRVGRRSPHQIRRGAAQNPGGPTLHRAILLPFSRPPANAGCLPYVRFTPESRHSHGSRKRSAYDPKRTFLWQGLRRTERPI